MATQAEKFRHRQERSKPKLPPQPKKKKPNAGTRHLRGYENGTLHEHTGLKGAETAPVVLEENLSGRPSRKSTRAGSHGHRGGESYEIVRIMNAGSAKVRHNRRS